MNTCTARPIEGTIARRWKVSVLAAELGVHRDTLDKARTKGTTSTKLARRLEELTGIDRRRFLYPSEFGDPWPEIVDLQNGHGSN